MNEPLDFDRDWYEKHLGSMTREQLEEELCRLAVARQHWQLVLERYGAGRVMIATARAMINMVRKQLAKTE